MSQKKRKAKVSLHGKDLGWWLAAVNVPCLRLGPLTAAQPPTQSLQHSEDQVLTLLFPYYERV